MIIISCRRSATRKGSGTMLLSQVQRNQSVRILEIREPGLRARLLRLGVTQGSLLTCLERIPLGPVLVRHHRQEIAIGREIAEKIHVEGGSLSCK